MRNKFDTVSVCKLLEQYTELFTFHESDYYNEFNVAIKNSELQIIAWKDNLIFFEQTDSSYTYYLFQDFFERLPPETKKIFMFNIDLFI